MKFAVAVSVAATVVGVTGAGHADDARPVDGPLRAVLYEVGRDHTAQKGFVGSVVWHTDAIASSAGSLTADVEIPDLEMMANVVVASNDDRSFRASHTVEIMVTLPPDFVHGRVINVPRIVMKEGETTPGIPLKTVAVKITPRLFQIGLSNIGTDRQRNIELIKELPWIDFQILFSDGNWAILSLEKAALGDRALAMLESPAVEPLPRVPTNPNSTASRANFLPEFKARPVVAPDPFLSRLFPKVPPRPSWMWPPLVPWAMLPGLPSGSWTWQPGWQPVLRETIRLASTTLAASTPGAKLPSWVLDTSRSVIPELVPPWPRVRPPDFRVPKGRSRFAGERNLEPPAQFVRWSDRLETVLAGEREVTRRCLAVGTKLPPSKIVRGCAHGAAGRCFIIRIEDPGVARHELAHCNGWKHPQP
jgi:hypothetical protein